MKFCADGGDGMAVYDGNVFRQMVETGMSMPYNGHSIQGEERLKKGDKHAKTQLMRRYHARIVCRCSLSRRRIGQLILVLDLGNAAL